MEYLKSLENIGIVPSEEVYWNLSIQQMIFETLKNSQELLQIQELWLVIPVNLRDILLRISIS